MKRALFVAVLVACGPTAKEIVDHNQRSMARADREVASAGPSFEPSRVVLPTNAVAVTQTGEDEALYADAASGELVFVSNACAERGRCGNECLRPVVYTYHHAADGHIVIVRRRVIEQVVRTEEDPSCPAGCGGGTPREEPAIQSELMGRGLGIQTTARVEVRSVTYTQQIVSRVCTNTTPVP